MSVWLREIAGWLLLAVGLFIFWKSYDLLLQKRIFEATPLAFMGVVVFRGGTHLLKVALAAQAARQLPRPVAEVVKSRPGRPTRSIAPTPAAAVIPGPRTARTRDDG